MTNNNLENRTKNIEYFINNYDNCLKWLPFLIEIYIYIYQPINKVLEKYFMNQF